MTTTIPALRADMGTWTYYITRMRAAEICEQVGIASETEEWENLSIEDLYQRDLNNRRVEKQIAPYLAQNKDRFFGSIIVMVRDVRSVEFEGMAKIGNDVPVSYRNLSEDIGFLTLGISVDGAPSVGLVALDGQHRLAALRHVVRGYVAGECAVEVADDEVTVLFVVPESIESTRRLFTTINRSARKVSTHDVLLMGEDDARAIVARRLASSKVLAPRGLENLPLIKWDSNTMPDAAESWTTLNALNTFVEVVATILRLQCAVLDDYTDRPSNNDLDALFNESLRWTELLFKAFPIMTIVAGDPTTIPDQRKPESEYSVLYKPAGFVVLVLALQSLIQLEGGGLDSVEDSIQALTKVNWSIKSQHWQGLLFDARGKISTRTNVWQIQANIIAAQLCESDMAPAAKASNLKKLREFLNNDQAKLPDITK
jgi:DNA sulfur modification protein DndB